MGLTNAQKRTMDDLNIHGGIVVYIDKGGRIMHSRQPIMNLPSAKIVNVSSLAEAREEIKHLRFDLMEWLSLAKRQYREMPHNEPLCPMKAGIEKTEKLLGIK